MVESQARRRWPGEGPSRISRSSGHDPETPRSRPSDRSGIPSGEDRLDRLAVVDVEAFPAGDLELPGVEAELLEDGGVDVGDVVAVLDGVEADLVGRPVDDRRP